ncbi:MAG: SDR family oxidoreductase [Caulobacteraceae bacterium]|nr:SDR family oxidoreductase [Caulobacteraceae bacterium]
MQDEAKIGARLAPLFSLSGKTALITGAGSGLGKATANLFAEVGAEVVVTDLILEAAQATAAQIEANGGVAIAVQCDVSDEASVKRAFAAADERFGKIDILVNNAAHRAKNEFFEMTVEEWDKMHHVCTRGTFLCSREAIKRMRAAGKGGAIVNISSMSAAHTNLWGINYHYDSAKSGVDALTRGLAGEFASERIRVNSVLPGGMKSEGVANMRANYDFRGPVTLPGRSLMGGATEPINVAHAVLFLASPAANFITGQMLAADGGFLVS